MRGMPLLPITLAFCALAPTGMSQALPGQVQIDPAYPQWLQFEGGGHPFYCGTGDPEDFFYRGTRQADGTRVGDQDALLDKLETHGGTTLYLEVVRSHGGDGSSDHNPFINSDPAQGLDQDILDQWEGWLQRCEDLDILIYLFIYDDSARIWSTGNLVGTEEDAFLRAIVDEFEHHPNLIWLVSEESEEAMSHLKANAIASILLDADDHKHIVGNHHHSGTTFKSWSSPTDLTHYSMHYDTPAANVHAGALQARSLGEAAGPNGNGYFTMYTEANFTKTASDDDIRLFLWDTSMAGVMPMVYGEDIANTSTTLLNQCRIVQSFFESTDFYRMLNRDDLTHAGTQWVLADEPSSYIAYAGADNGDLGLDAMLGGFYDLHWVDAVSGATVDQPGVLLGNGAQAFARPGGIGEECAVWLKRSWKDLGFGLAGLTGEPLLQVDSSMIPGTPFALSLSNAKPNSFIYNIAGFSLLQLPFEGGTLVPALDVMLFGATDSSGVQSLQAPFPNGMPTGASAWIQCWLADSSAVAGLAASNAVQGIAP